MMMMIYSDPRGGVAA